MELKELLAELLKLDRASVLAGLQADAHAIFQSIFDKGHSTATATATADKTRLEGLIGGMQTQLEQAQTTIKELEKKAPDIAAVRSQFEAEVQRLQREHKDALKVKDQEIIAERKSRSSSDLRTKLIAKGVDPDYAQVLTDKPDVLKRLRPNDKGQVDVLQADSEVPFAPAKGQDGLDLLADELHKATPPKFISSTTDRGSGTDTEGQAGGAKGGALYEKIRTDAKKRHEQTSTSKSAAEKLGMKV